MKREILFRGKMVDNGEWRIGDLIVNSATPFKFMISDVGLKVDDRTRGIRIQILHETVGQFIGRTDKHGTKIFEGDYLADRYTEDGTEYITKLPVIWDNEKLCWAVDTSFAGDGSYSQPIADFFGDTELEVIGNIWDNPEKHGGDGN